MNILITNDDGISSQGILALEKILGPEHKTFLIAPLKERSATSMALSIYDTLRVEKVNDNHYIVDGYPVDCVNIGLHGNIFPEVDLVLSGINRGVNMGYDVHYSGTVGAARHGAIHKKLSIAISSGNMQSGYDYYPEAQLIKEFIKTFADKLNPGTVYNFNVPPNIKPEISKIEIARLGVRTYTDTYSTSSIIGGISDFSLGGSILGYHHEEGTDFTAYYSGKIPLTPLSLDQTSHVSLQKLKQSLSHRVK
ncbi:5'/3'-nucleotidase SurE [Leptospira perolatii]|uniref:5'-nucleotidase SurE n=1 Tax=Leptospira perolatii TaxID=2023191 RepID=A0A2M9ZSG4_9LEPT|nr:5'/3'-nucleotidase SurE [Leptospira perolatii]PJZ71430.1 5'/3'-nucleotidase SurE [Leptospira perolatii]PJZ74964.1 5'/3'-nucleotidase SurE [Leptospira perolatii]